MAARMPYLNNEMYQAGYPGALRTFMKYFGLNYSVQCFKSCTKYVNISKRNISSCISRHNYSCKKFCDNFTTFEQCRHVRTAHHLQQFSEICCNIMHVNKTVVFFTFHNHKLLPWQISQDLILVICRRKL